MHSPGGRKAGKAEEKGGAELQMFVGHENLKQHLSCCQLVGFGFRLSVCFT